MGVTASVLIPAFNAADFLRTALDSALAQTLDDIEVVVVDDGSRDGTWAVISAYAARDRRVLPVRLAAQSGPAAARNAGLAQASGRWVALLDADDAFLPDRLATLVPRAEALGADLLADNLMLRDFATGRPLGRALDEAVMQATGPLTLAELLRGDMPDRPMRRRLGFLQPILRRAFLAAHGLRYDEDIRSGEDILLYCTCIARGARFHLTPDAGYVCAVRDGSETSNRRLTRHQGIATRRILAIAGTDDAEIVSLLRRRQRLIDFTCFRESLADGNLSNALRDVRAVPPALLLGRLAGALQRRTTALAFGAWTRP